MKFELQRKMDSIGRIVIPADLRNYYDMKPGSTVVILPVRDGIQIAKSEYFIMEELSDVEVVLTIDSTGRFRIPCAFKKLYHFNPQNILSIVPYETCMLIYKNDVA
jgi:AbrB family looped-hinge helix DNA binding protein